MSDAARRAVDAAYERWISAAVAGDADAYADFFEEDGVLMPPNAPIVRGRQAIREWAKWLFSTYRLEVSTYSMEHQIVSDAVAVSRYVTAGTYRPVNGGDGIPFDQKYADALVKLADGAWKMNSHMWSSNRKGHSLWG